ncbi:MAG: prepilin-type N-terminal cleavage/methylation domain-containing protein [Deltaproteobacteria bacterium]|nr:prepilin-type N-terminal cleavage/methylation domain-containing protein [Deltaproteobacteria bacterium]MBW1994603.1 prepilin-type N-terminal cleavage/methylation domain-containing protein [Deltaproteobacteria bacterium]MBW2153166.1 prepilin-type N-terminal cleavage/methylation domain-containing protein [Deltaproteobacteria bacterium]
MIDCHSGRIGKKDSGFTLVEVLVTMVILAIALLGMAALLAGIMQGNTYSNMVTTATTLAQEKLEEVRRIGYSGVESGEENYGDITDFPLFKRTTNVTSDSPAAGMKTVTVTVYWNSNNKSVELKTILTD